jgi:hypothetical protein
LLATSALLWIPAIVVVAGMHRTAVSVRNTAAPAYLDVIEARAVLSDADRAVWQSLRSGEVQFLGPGPQYESDITTAEQDLQQVAALEARGSTGSKLLQTLTGQLVTYQGQVEQADAAYREDTALGPASSHDLGYAYSDYAWQSLRGSGGLLPNITTLSDGNRRALNGRFSSLWTDPVLFVVFAIAGIVVLSLVMAFQLFLRRRFRRTLNPPLLLAAALVCGLIAWMGAVMLPADASFTAARKTALPQLVGKWQTQIHTVDTQARALQTSASANIGDAAGALSVDAIQVASATLDSDLASAQATGGLLFGIPIIAIVIAGLVFIAVKPRLDEYRG